MTVSSFSALGWLKKGVCDRRDDGSLRKAQVNPTDATGGGAYVTHYCSRIL